MRNTLPKILILALLLAACQDVERQPTRENPFYPIRFEYPQTYRDTSVVDNYFGENVPDPYRWLEEDNGGATQRWVRAQRSITTQFFDNIPFREAFRQRLTQLWDYERYGVPVQREDRLFLLKNDGLQDQDVLYQFIETPDGPQYEEVLNPNRLSSDQTTSLADFTFSPDGSLLAYQLSEGGSDWRTIRVLDMEEKTVLRDSLRWVKFSDISWYKDGFFYSRYPEPLEMERLSGVNEFHQVYYHRVGTSQSLDELVFVEHTSPQRNFSTQVSEDERYLFIYATESTSGNALYFRDLTTEEVAFTPIAEDFRYEYEIVGTDRNSILVLTNDGAPRRRVVRISLTRPDKRYWEEVIPEAEDQLLEVHLFNDQLVAHYLHDVNSQVRIFDRAGQSAGALKLPELGSITAFSGGPSQRFAYFSFTSFTQPATIYQLDLENLGVSRFLTPEIDFDGAAYETKQVWYESYDGTRIPMFIIHKRGLQPTAETPALLYGYGGFNIPVLPVFNRTRLNLFPVVLENNGVCAVANIRGGGEFGEEWHKAGTVFDKQNVFDDFQAAAEYLIGNRYTSSDKLAIYGRSNGGLLVGACLTQRPDLYAVAIPAVGVLDMLRYHKFTIGWAWAADYGTSDVEKEFDYLFAYSPLHNIIEDDYPATLITTADHDDRVAPAHSFKFAAKLQAQQRGDEPILIRIEENVGHGAGAPVSKSIEEGADVLTFMFYNMKQDIVYEY